MPHRIRLATPADAAATAAIYDPICRDTAISFEAEGPGPIEMARRIETTFERYPWLVYETDAGVVGYGYASPYNARAAYQWTAEASIYVAASAQGQGIASALYTSLFRILKAQGCCSISAGITLPNPGSVALHERFGFEPRGVYEAAGYKLGAWHDVGYWRLALRSLDGPPPPLVPIRELMGQAGWAELLNPTPPQ